MQDPGPREKGVPDSRVGLFLAGHSSCWHRCLCCLGSHVVATSHPAT